MLQTNRRTTLKLLGGAALAVAALPVLPLPSAAQQEDLVVPNNLQNFKRGTINSMHPEVRSFTIVWEDLGRVKMKAADLVTNYPALKPGQIVDSHWYDYMDFLIAKKTPETAARAKAMLAQGARLQGIPGAQQRIRLWNMDGMVTKVDLAANVVYLINASGGEPDKPAPDSGEVIQMPPIVTPAGKAALQTIKVGDTITTVFSQQTAIDATIIR
jgi:Cu/Ag efflux protein CusF